MGTFSDWFSIHGFIGKASGFLIFMHVYMYFMYNFLFLCIYIYFYALLCIFIIIRCIRSVFFLLTIVENEVNIKEVIVKELLFM